MAAIADLMSYLERVTAVQRQIHPSSSYINSYVPNARPSSPNTKLHQKLSILALRPSIMAASMNSNAKLFLLVAMAALLSASTSAGWFGLHAADSTLLNKVCSKHTDAKFCGTELGKASFSDLPTLATASLDLTKARAVNTNNIKALHAKEKNEKAKKLLQDCLSHYGEAAAAIEESRASFKAKDYWKMNSDASAASTYGGSCEEGFVDAKLTSPLTADNKGLQNSAQIVEIVANVIAGKA